MEFSARRVVRSCVAAGLAIAAFARGKYLLGWDAGVVYAVVSIGFIVPLMRAEQGPRPALWQRTFSVISAVVVGVVIFFPTLVISDVEIFVQKQATDRAVRADLQTLFTSNPQYSELSVTTQHLKTVVVMVFGTVENCDLIDNLAGDLKTVSQRQALAVVQWEVTCRDTNATISSNDYWQVRRPSESPD